MSTRKRQLLKIIILGDSGVGKTSLMHQYVSHRFDSRYKATIGADFLTKDVEINGRVVTLQIWDTAGQERFQSLGSAFYRGADACILVFDVTQQESFAHVGSWLEEFSIQAGRRDSVLVGNKTDLEDRRQVASKTAQAWCAKQNAEASSNNDTTGFEAGEGATPQIKYFESSAKESAGVEEAFVAVAQLALAKKATVEDAAPMPQTVNLTQPQTEPAASSSACSC
ncbi:putative mitochondrial rab7 GTP binding protein [Leptomonas pyrrhocoris]|uniref:Ras-related protein Rab-7b n=1 Tax=Leptomonas pyrrhocoris TaxID=157538 RepID=A0A0M9FYP0_LEPPY|nr:putative mitochondrial rab7 GTP binding protein [Leptomonas pyrrhocoris]XP_015657015.1 putative mitochondrial rab7 GTP binding protein [Leptomonas pyrrhocoris]KPA78570.1 putative mitochondrial rab7 GTP binding protein [Leptomonas pyrrhocoris]KPA78576.1 putative mitochondrial rab7 GTP binding protein [Leptomonas pyrrhocoris]|eukprot:XP_015657009.1 putative mitochondrial rab7 GTP binding protein [Leptomonas pyrrhocoris]